MNCNIARDCLPLYFDGLCSIETRKQLEEHIEHCEDCKQLKQSLKADFDETDEKQEWDKAIVPLKKVKKKIHRKNVLIVICVCFLVLLVSITTQLAYGQITKRGISFELLYDAVRFQYIGGQFAEGNIEPLYDNLDNGFLLQDAESSVLRLAYADSETYDADMKEAILEKYQQYFEGKGLTYKGIEEIGYCENAITGWNRILRIILKFEDDSRGEYYIVLYKTLNGKYLVDDYFGNPYLTYVSEEAVGETEYENVKSYHTDDTLFACLPNRLKDFDLYFLRHMVLVSGQRALQGDTTLAENGQMRFSIVSEKDLADGTVHLQEEVNDKLDSLEDEGYYVTDITWSVEEYDKTKHLYRYQINIELTNESNLEQIIVSLDCYRVSDKFVYIPKTDKLYVSNVSEEVISALEALYD